MIERPSPNHDARTPGQPVDILVLHYTGMRSGEAALDRLCDPEAKVSAHYLIHEDGTLCRLVDEARRAWHAGVSHWAGVTDINARSIGIELVNPGHDFGYRPFPAPQMAALEALCGEILDRHPIPPARVLGHSDVAPTRKIDPGELFDWSRLAAAGVGLWPVGSAPLDPVPPRNEVLAWLRTYGYDAPEDDTDRSKAAVSAFQRHFRPARFDGVVDGETAALALQLVDAMGTRP